METEKQILIDVITSETEILNTFLHEDINKRSFKTSEGSIEARRQGNAFFLAVKHDDDVHAAIFEHYCRSIALAPNKSEELAFSYGNRSAFLIHINKYKESLYDIERALEITDNVILRIKLLCRKAECLKALGLSTFEDLLKQAEKMIAEVDDNNVAKKFLENLFSKIKDLNVDQSEKEENEEIKKSEISNFLMQKESSIFKSVDINYNDKYGRHLVAKKHFLPGEIIFVEKLYATNLNFMNNYRNCYNCLKVSWSSIPCEHCSWAMFCSNTCKEEAWKKHHDVECMVIPHVQMMNYSISIRMLIMGLKEAGSISNLKTELESFDKRSDYSTCRKFITNTFKDIYTLKSTYNNKITLQIFAFYAIKVLIILYKYSSVFDNSKFDNIADLKNNADAIFLGTLLIKLCSMKLINAFDISGIEKRQNHLKPKKQSDNICTSIKGTGIAVIASLINHSCIPNVERCFSEDQQIIIFANQPIKKKSQLFMSYQSSFGDEPIEVRHFYLTNYEFRCDCQACLENWPPVFKNSAMASINTNDQDFILEYQFINNCKDILLFDDIIVREYSQEELNRLSTNIVKAVKRLKPSSPVVWAMIYVLCKIVSSIYGLRLSSFGLCKNM